MIKTILCENTNILFRKNYWKLGKMNARFWKNSENKGKVTSDSFRNFVYVSNYMHLKSFVWNFKTKNVTNLTKVTQQNSYRVLQVTSKWKTLKQPICFIKAVEFWPTFDIQVDIKVAKPHLLENQRSLSKHIGIHINRAVHCKITAF